MTLSETASNVACDQKAISRRIWYSRLGTGLVLGTIAGGLAWNLIEYPRRIEIEMPNLLSSVMRSAKTADFQVAEACRDQGRLLRKQQDFSMFMDLVRSAPNEIAKFAIVDGFVGSNYEIESSEAEWLFGGAKKKPKQPPKEGAKPEKPPPPTTTKSTEFNRSNTTNRLVSFIEDRDDVADAESDIPPPTSPWFRLKNEIIDSLPNDANKAVLMTTLAEIEYEKLSPNLASRTLASANRITVEVAKAATPGSHAGPWPSRMRALLVGLFVAFATIAWCGFTGRTEKPINA